MAAIWAWRSSSDCSSLTASSRFLITSSFCRQTSSNDDSCKRVKRKLVINKNITVSVFLRCTNLQNWNYCKIPVKSLYIDLLSSKQLPLPVLHSALHTHPSLPIHKHQPYAIIPSVLSPLLLSHFSAIHFSLADHRYSFHIVSSLPLVSGRLYGAL